MILNYDKILKVIQSLDPNKAHGHYGISVRMLKLSFPSIIKPFLIMFCNWLYFANLEPFQMTGKRIALFQYLRKISKYLMAYFLKRTRTQTFRKSKSQTLQTLKADLKGKFQTLKADPTPKFTV